MLYRVGVCRPAAMCQYVIGFWWNSVDRTRTLDPAKRDEYSAMLDEMCGRPSLTLNEMQVAAGRIQRCVMTFPPEAGASDSDSMPGLEEVSDFAINAME